MLQLLSYLYLFITLSSFPPISLFSLNLSFKTNKHNTCIHPSTLPTLMHCSCTINLDHFPPMLRKALDHQHIFSRRCIVVNGPVIIGAGPSGLAIAAGLKRKGVPFVILDRADCIASLWQNKTYDRLKLHLPKQFCQLPFFPFPPNFPEYPSKYEFIRYLESYANNFEITPRFNESVRVAKYEEGCGLWRVVTVVDGCEVEYICRWLVVATGENAEKVVPEFEGLDEFSGDVSHACDYRTGEPYAGKRVLVVGCGNSGMEVSLDLCHHLAFPFMVVRNSVHVLPREIAGKSTFELAMLLMKWLPVNIVDKILLILARYKLGNLEKYGIKRPLMGPIELKNSKGKTPVLDIGALQKIKSGKIRIVPGIKKFSRDHVELVNGENLEIDSVIFATGYCSNVPSWLKESELFTREGMGTTSFPEEWKGKCGLYSVGFTRRGILGASFEAIRVSQDIANIWNQENKSQNNHYVTISCDRRCNKHKNNVV